MAVALTQKLLDGLHDSLVPLVVCAMWVGRVPTQENVKIKVSHSVVAVWTVVEGREREGGEGAGGGGGEGHEAWYEFNLISFTIFYKA